MLPRDKEEIIVGADCHANVAASIAAIAAISGRIAQPVSGAERFLIQINHTR
jgi:hypothetical protein